jgi:hypothetical protein
MTSEPSSHDQEPGLRISVGFQATEWPQMGQDQRHKRHIASTLCGFAQDSPDWRPFPTDLLPPGLAAYVRAEAEATVVDESMVGLPLLVAMAGAIGGSRQAGVKRGWIEPCMLWGALVAPASSGKTPAAQNILRLIRERDQQVFTKPTAGRVPTRVTPSGAIDWKGIVSDVQAEREAGLPSTDIDALLDELANPRKYQYPHPTRYCVQDATTEQLLSVLEKNPRGVLMVRDELSGLFGSFGARSSGKGSVDRSKYLSIWSAEHLSDDRKTMRSSYVPGRTLRSTAACSPVCSSAV